MEVDLDSSSLAMSSIEVPNLLIDCFSRTCLSPAALSATASLRRHGSKVNSFGSFVRLELVWLWLSLCCTAVNL